MLEPIGGNEVIVIILIFGMIALLMGKTGLAIGFFLGAIIATLFVAWASPEARRRKR